MFTLFDIILEAMVISLSNFAMLDIDAVNFIYL